MAACGAPPWRSQSSLKRRATGPTQRDSKDIFDLETLLTPIRHRFGTKAEVLEKLASSCHSISIPPLCYFSVMDWRDSETARVSEIMTLFAGHAVAIRSSAINEDSAANSMAGAYESILNVPTDSPYQIAEAITAVASNFDDNPNNQVLVQRMVEDVTVSGVIMSHALSDGSPYMVIDYDDETGRTDVVTGGTGTHKNVIVYRNLQLSSVRSDRVRLMIELVKQLESVFVGVPIDVEFAIDKSGKFISSRFGASTVGNWSADVERYVKRLPFLKNYIKAVNQPLPGLAGIGRSWRTCPIGIG